MGKNNKHKKIRKDDGYCPQGNPEHLALPIEALQLSEKTYDAIKAGGLLTLGDLAKRRISEMYHIQNIGKKNCIEISGKLSQYNLKFREEEQKPQGEIAPQPNVLEKTPERGRQNNVRNDSRLNQRPQPNQRQNNKGKQQQKSKYPIDNVNRGLNESLSRQYAGMTIAEILNGKRQRPPKNFVEKEKLTADSIIKFFRKGKWGYKDWKGNVLIQPTFDEAFSFSEGLACVEMDEKLGFINTKGEFVIDCKYECASSFRSGKAVVLVDGKCGYIDKEENFIIEPIYDVATPFEDGVAVVELDGRWGVLSEDGKVFWR